MKRYTFSIDNASADWWQYHFDDALLRNDVSWRSWRIALQQQLTQEQLHGKACGVCGRALTGKYDELLLGGYTIGMCHSPCQSLLQQDMQNTLTTIET